MIHCLVRLIDVVLDQVVCVQKSNRANGDTQVRKGSLTRKQSIIKGISARIGGWGKDGTFEWIPAVA